MDDNTLNQTNTTRPVKRRKKKSQLRAIWRRMLKNKIAMVGLVIFAIIFFCMVFANFIVPYEVALEQVIEERLQPPSLQHWFGTDNFGRDIFARIIYGTRYSLSLGIIAVAVGLVIGGVFGSVAGYFGGIIDGIIMRIMDTILTMPSILLSLLIVAALGPGFTNVMIALSIAQIPYYARVVRSAILNIVGQDFIEAGKACGTPNLQIIFRHVLPNAIGTIIVQATMKVGVIIITAAALGFLGMGIQPPTPEWGGMLSEGKNYMMFMPWIVLVPGLAITITSLSLNLMGDGLRDALDPRLKD